LELIELKILILGDSHTMYAEHAKNNGLFNAENDINIIKCSGATTHGLGNPKSKTQGRNTFKENIKKHKPDVTIFHMGEVDCGYVIWYWAQNKNISIHEQLYISIDNYFNFVSEFTRDVKHVAITSATPPSITDDDAKLPGSVSDVRGDISASQLERTQLTQEFNKECEKRCESFGYTYIPLYDGMLSNGVIDKKYQTRKKMDHHFNSSMMAPIWAKHINNYIDKL